MQLSLQASYTKLVDTEREMTELRNRRVEIKTTDQYVAMKKEEDKEVQKESEVVKSEEQLMNRLEKEYNKL